MTVPRSIVAIANVVAVAATAMISPATLHAQTGHIGAIVGATYTTLRGVDGLDNRTGLLGGLSVVVPTSGFFTWQPEILLVSKGAKGTNRDESGLKLNYLEIPVLLRLNLNRSGTVHPHLYAGPYFGMQIDCRIKGTSSDCDDVPGVSTKTVDVGGAAGGGLDFDTGPFVLSAGLRYSFGVSTVADFEFDNVRESAKNGAWAIYTGAAIRLGRRNR